jgi:3-hydroxyisobutyrate dehydrogenase-like beta-hydroxyacid dehydrogenase
VAGVATPVVTSVDAAVVAVAAAATAGDLVVVVSAEVDAVDAVAWNCSPST